MRLWWRDFHQRFVGSAIGWIWGVIHPLVLLVCWWFVFIVVLKQKLEGVSKKLVGFEMLDRGIPRNGYEIANAGKGVGYVTSGMFAPTLEKNIGLGYVPPDLTKIGTEFDIIIRGKPLRARVVKTPFYANRARGK